MILLKYLFFSPPQLNFHVRFFLSNVNAALIDDELANTKVSKQLICEPQHYTIYERFQDIEHALGGEERIYDLWQNWGDNRNDVQFRLKINKEKEQEIVDCKAKAKVSFGHSMKSYATIIFKLRF